jgi:hypothetical protein
VASGIFRSTLDGTGGWTGSSQSLPQIHDPQQKAALQRGRLLSPVGHGQCETNDSLLQNWIIWIILPSMAIQHLENIGGG